MAQRACRRWTFGPILAAALAAPCGPAAATPGFVGPPAPNKAKASPLDLTGATPERLKAFDDECGESGRVEDALKICYQLYLLDKSDPDVLDRLRKRLRQFHQIRRHSDDRFTEKFLALSDKDALKLYGEVVGKLQLAYVDRDKVTPTRLYQQGVEEFVRALKDAGFRERHLRGLDDDAVAKFARQAVRAWTDREVKDVKQAQAVLGELCMAARRTLKIAAFAPVVLEFVCGACHSLDEYSAYLTAGDYLADAGNPAGPSVGDVELVKGAIGYLKITHFAENTPQEFDAAFKSLELQANMTGRLQALIVDLRGNSGGSFAAALQVSERFLGEGVIVTTQGQLDEYNKAHTSASGAGALRTPLVLLVDADTASAAEVLAGAMRDRERARVVGTLTLGKGSLQGTIKFDGDDKAAKAGAMRITLARLFSPSGAPIGGSGVRPHVVEPVKERQRDAAVAEASKFSPGLTVPQ